MTGAGTVHSFYTTVHNAKLCAADCGSETKCFVQYHSTELTPVLLDVAVLVAASVAIVNLQT